MTRYTMSTDGADGGIPGERVSTAPPSMEEVEAFGDAHAADRVAVVGDGLVTLYVPSVSGEWWPLCSGVDEGTADEMRLWDDLVRLVPSGRAPADHPLMDRPEPAAGTPVDAAEAVRLVAKRIRRDGLDYPADGLVADRIATGWSVYAPVDVDEDDPMAFLDMPVGRSVFLVSDVGRIKEVSSSVPPGVAEMMFAAEEAYVRRPVGADPFATEFWAEFERLSGAADGEGAVVADVTFVDDGLADRAAALASGLITPIAQQLSLLGPAGWTRFEARFSSTVSAETGRLRFWVGQDPHDVPVPEQIAVLVRRQRSLAARMPAGPWWRLVLMVDLTAPGAAGVITEYDYGDVPLPDDQLLDADDYRRDLEAYPRSEVPEWLRRYVAGAGADSDQTAGSAPAEAPAPTPAERPKPASAPALATTPASSSVRGPVLDTRHDGSRLYASDEEVIHGRARLALDDVRWVRYPVVRVATKRFLFPTTYDTTFHFGIGVDNDSPRKLADITFLRLRKNSQPPQAWLFLVDLVRRRVEPRLLTEFAAAVARGQSVVVGGLSVGPEGVSGRGSTLAWEEFAGTQLADGRVRVLGARRERAVFEVGLGERNAVLLPDLLAHLSR